MRARPVQGEPVSPSERPPAPSSSPGATSRGAASAPRAPYVQENARSQLTVQFPPDCGSAVGQAPEAPPRARPEPLGAAVCPTPLLPIRASSEPPEPFPDGHPRRSAVVSGLSAATLLPAPKSSRIFRR